MKTPHKHADFIKAWADGAEIEYRTSNGASWSSICLGWSWDNTVVAEYRKKPEPKPDVVEKYFASGYTKYGCVRVAEHFERENLKLTFDGETGKLKAAEVIA
jgi:hypothetical protein